MTLSHSLAAKNDISDAVLALIDAGTGFASLKLRTTSDVTKATLTMADPAGTVATATGILTFDCAPALEDTSTAAGTVVKGIISDPASSIVLNCSVGTAGEDINLSNNIFGLGDTVQITALTYTPPT